MEATMTVYEKIQAGHYENKLPWPSREHLHAQRMRQAYNAETSRLEAQFTADAFAELEIANNPKANAAYQLAWQYGHSAGYSEVFGHLSDLAELIR